MEMYLDIRPRGVVEDDVVELYVSLDVVRLETSF